MQGRTEIPPQSVFCSQEAEKRLAYGERVQRIEQGSFTPLVFSCAGGAGPAASSFLKRLASKVADKNDMEYSLAVGWLRCRLSFALLRSAIVCIRGSRGRHRHDPTSNLPPVATAEGCVSN